MISVQEARNLIEQQVRSLPAQQVSLKDATGLTLAEDIYAIIDVPNFIQSSVDGYAFAFNGKDERLRISGEMAAGAVAEHTIASNEAARIFTGAPLPSGADTVVMQEYCTTENDVLIIEDGSLKQGDNVRPKGSEINKGALAMQAGEQLTPAAIGFLAGIGIDKVKVYPAPKVSLIITGKEIQQPGQVLNYGQVYDTNSVMLRAALQSAGIKEIEVLFVDDFLEDVTQQLTTVLQTSNVVLLTGGISVGDYDFVLQATKDCGVQQHFHRIKQKPGKPLYFGTKDNTLVFGLPGNPSSSLTCFYEYVLPALDAILQRPATINKSQAVLQNDYSKKATLTHFLKGSFKDGKATLLSAQESYRLASYAKANCLVVFAEEKEIFKAGDSIEIHHLP